jgi:ATP-dependent exoDNAse (exonuclease V) beta subunit
MKQPVDIDVRNRVVEDLGTSFCLEAGAGTGKTTLLVERLLSILRRGAATGGEIAAITFTEKAAAEMKTRLGRSITGLLAEGGMDDVERERLEAALGDLERLQISTIHSFASAILREHPIEGGVDPGFRVLDAIDSGLFLEECFGSYLASADATGQAPLQRFLSVGGNVDRLRSIALLVYHHREESRGGRIFESSRPSCGDGTGDQCMPERLRDRVLSAAGEMERLACEGCDSPDDLGYVEIFRFRDDSAVLESAGADDLTDLLLHFPMPAVKGNMKNWSCAESCRRQKEIARELAVAQEDFRCRYMDSVAGDLMAWCGGFIDYVEERKRVGGFLDFEDLLIRARKVLDDPIALGELRGRYRFILVDEFQDTNPLQAEIVMLLAVKPGADCIEPEPGKLFVVGDPKQSIYRFRKADVEIYDLIREKITKAGEAQKITQNFRSVPGITGWVNRAFSRIIERPDDGRYQPDYEPIHPGRSGEGPAVFLLDLGDDFPGVEEFRGMEGRGVARLIRKLVSGGWKITDRETGRRRKIRYSDIALIYRTTTGIDNYEQPLRDEGIPYMVEGGKLYYTRQEIRDIVNAVWAIEDPFDRMALVSVLRSPLFGVSDEELFLFKRSGGRLCYLDYSPSPGESTGVIGEAFESLADLHRNRGARGTVTTLKLLLSRTGYLSVSKLRPHGRQRLLNIGKMIQTARIFEERMHSFRFFARWIRHQDMYGLVEGESPMIDEDENAVRLLTIHKAKGLQFPVVILVNLVQRYGVAIGEMTSGGSLSLSIGKGWKTSGFDRLSQWEHNREEAEIRRLLYVAATRAGDMLFVPRAPKPAGLFEIIQPFVSIEDGSVPGDVSVVDIRDLPAASVPGEPFTRIPGISAAKAGAMLERRERFLSARSELIAGATAGPVIVTPSGLESPGTDVVETAAGVQSEGALLGRAFHKAIELVMKRRPFQDVSRAALKAAVQFGLDERAEEIAGLCGKVLTSPLIAEAVASERLMVEVPFSVPTDPAGTGGHLIEGRIDLLFGGGGRWTVVDFKTDDTGEAGIDMRMERYRRQGAVYALALERLGIDPSARVIFYFVRTGKTRSLETGPALLDEARELVRTAVAASIPCST